MAVRIAPVARQQFFSSQGVVAAGMKLFTYAAGTTNKLATFTTSTGGVQNANPIVLDSAGRTPSGLWLTDGSLYKFVLAPANDTDPPTSPIWTEDNVGANDATLSALLASTGSSIVGYIQAAAGAIARTVRDLLREKIRVSDFGADPSASAATNTAAIQAALTFAMTFTRAEVDFGRGDYNINAPLKLDRGASETVMGIKLKGENARIIATTAATAGATTRLQPVRVSGAPGTDTDDYNVAACLVVFAPNSVNITNFQIDGVSFGASGAAIGNVIGVFAPRIAQSSFKNMMHTSDLSKGMEIRNFYLCEFENVRFEDCTWPIHHNRSAGDLGGTTVNFTNVSAYNCSRGWEFDNLVSFNADGLAVEEWAAGNYAFKFVNRCIGTMSGGHAESGNGGGIYLEGANATSYASATIGGRTQITVNGPVWAFGDTAVPNIATFGFTTSTFSIIKRDAELRVTGGYWQQEFNTSVQIPVSLEHVTAHSTKQPAVYVDGNVDFGLDAADFVGTGDGDKIGRAFITRNGIKQNGTNATYPYASKPVALLKKSVDQTFSSGTPAKLTFAAPATYDDPMGWATAGLDGWTVNSCGKYKVEVSLLLENVATTDAIDVFVKHGGSTWKAQTFYGNGLAKQCISMWAHVNVFAVGSDITVECNRGSSGVNVTVQGDSAFNQIHIEQI